MSDIADLGRWLRKTPQPHFIRVDGDNAKKIEVGNKGGKWKDIIRTIEAMDASKVEALDAAGGILRAGTIGADVEEESSATPKGATDIQVFANLIAAGYEKGAKAQEPLLAHCLSFIERMSSRLAVSEKEIERLRGINARLQAELLAAAATPAQEDPGILGGLVSGLLQAQNGVGEAGPPQKRPPHAPAPGGKRS